MEYKIENEKDEYIKMDSKGNSMWCDCASCNNTSISAKDLVEKLQKVKITIKSEELGLSKQQLIEKRKTEREKEAEKARKKMWENAEAAMYKINERVLRMKKETDERENKDLDAAMYRINERFLGMKKLMNKEKTEEQEEDPDEEPEEAADEPEESEEEAADEPEESEEESEEKPWKVGRVTY